jgi:predicted DsbA family dithiol-disulfide isomerase
VRIDRLRRSFEIEIQWRAFPLHPEIPPEGMTIEQLFAGRKIDIPGMRRRFKQVADELGLPLGERDKTYNTRLAQELAKWAESMNRGDEFHDGVFRAYFAQARNIGNPEVLVELAVAAGLPGEEARGILNSRRCRESVDADWSRAQNLGITAVPTFILKDQIVVGAQPYEVLEGFLQSGGIRRRRPEKKM